MNSNSYEYLDCGGQRESEARRDRERLAVLFRLWGMEGAESVRIGKRADFAGRIGEGFHDSDKDQYGK